MRRYQGFRPKALAAHRAELLDVLDDAPMRARIIEWLNDKPSLAKNDVELLRVAAARADRWFEDLQSQSSAGRRADPKPKAEDQAGALEREKERTRKAREETRRIKDETVKRVEAVRGQIARLSEALDEERQLRRELEKDVRSAQSQIEKLRNELDRERRRAKTISERTEATADQARSDLKEARRELRQKGRELAELELKAKRAGAAAAKSRSTRAAKPAGPRKPLPVPKGRFEDAPETLEHWLGTKDVELLIDGYNASMAEGGFGNLELEAQRKRLIDETAKLARRKGIRATIVFDGADVGAARRRSRGPVTVQYSKPGEIADDGLIALLEHTDPVPVVVATNDKELQARARRLGATIATSNQLLALLR